jgi:hypothetical protein
MEDRFEEIVAAEEREVAGEAVTAPRYEGSTDLEVDDTPEPGRSRRPAYLAAGIIGVLIAAVAVVSSQATSLSNWGWVAYAYTVTYSSMIGYVTWLVWRIHVIRQRVEEVL